MRKTPSGERLGAASSTNGERTGIILDWLIRIRWGAVAGQLILLASAQWFLGARLPLGKLLGIVAALAISNVVLGAAKRRYPPRLLGGAALAFDILQLSGILHATGGAHNPFSVLYLVHITLAAVVLGARWTWFLSALSVGCYGLLFATHTPLEPLDHRAPEMDLHLQGMWVAFTIAASLTAYLVVKLSAAIEERDAAMAVLRERTARIERIASVATMAAGAAHELGTPLATIAVAAKELEHTVGTLPGAQREPIIEDVSLIRSELDRCRGILDRLAAGSGQTAGEAPVAITIEDLVAAVTEALPAPRRRRLRVVSPNPERAVRLPRTALVQVAQSLLSNAFEAGSGPVELSIDVGAHGLRLSVQDEGRGMPREVLSRAGEPFFSTRPPGEGMGLGVFIARTLSEQMGGRLRLESEPGRGTTAAIEIPAALAGGGDGG